MFTMYDSVTLDEIPAEPHAVAAYIDGDFANYDEARRRFPHARILRISVNSGQPADAYDIERGDYTPANVRELYTVAKDHGVWRPCFYAQLSGVMGAVANELDSVIKVRADVRLWVAFYNGAPALPNAYDAHQFTDRALGRNLDESICRDTFFQPATAAPARAEPKPLSLAEQVAELEREVERIESAERVERAS